MILFILVTFISSRGPDPAGDQYSKSPPGNLPILQCVSDSCNIVSFAVKLPKQVYFKC